MFGESPVPVKAGDAQASFLFLEVVPHFVQPFHHRMIDQSCCGQFDDEVLSDGGSRSTRG